MELGVLRVYQHSAYAESIYSAWRPKRLRPPYVQVSFEGTPSAIFIIVIKSALMSVGLGTRMVSMTYSR